MRRVVVVVACTAAALLLPAGALASTGPGDVDPLEPSARAWYDDNGPLRVGWTDFGLPIAGVEDGVVDGGYGVELWDLAALQVGIEVEHVLVGTNDDVAGALATGTIDVAGGFAPRADLRAVAEPAGAPLAWVGTGFLGTPETAAASSGAPGAQTVSTIAGSPLEATLLERFPDLTYVATDNPPAGLALVAAGELDLYFGPRAAMGHQMQRTGITLVPVGDTVDTVMVQAWALPDTAAAEVAAVALDSLSPREKALIHVRWTGFDLTDPTARAALPAWVLPASVTLVGLLLAAVLFVLVLRQRVAAATDELRGVNDRLEDLVDQRTSQLSESSIRLRRSNKALQRFAGTVAHDLRGPISAIGGLAEIVRVMPLGEDERAEVLARIHASANRLGRMVEAMLEDAVELGAGPGHISGTSFEDWLREVTAPELEIIDGELRTHVPDATIDADAEVLRRAAINLVGNATKYAVNEHGVVIEVSLRRHAEVWALSVEDNGPGIPQAMWSEVFERGKRLDHDDDRGFGLGLGAVRDIVQGAGGAIRLGDSELGGAAFTVTLPVIELDDEDDEAQTEVAGGVAG